MSKRQRDKRQTGADTGFISVLGIPEAQRDELAKRDWTKPQVTTDPNDPDNWSTAECVSRSFSGYRIYHLTQEVELWVVGYIKARVKLDLVRKDPGILATMHEEVFATAGTLIETDGPVVGGDKRIRVKKGVIR